MSTRECGSVSSGESALLCIGAQQARCAKTRPIDVGSGSAKGPTAQQARRVGPPGIPSAEQLCPQDYGPVHRARIGPASTCAPRSDGAAAEPIKGTVGSESELSHPETYAEGCGLGCECRSSQFRDSNDVRRSHLLSFGRCDAMPCALLRSCTVSALLPESSGWNEWALVSQRVHMAST